MAPDHLNALPEGFRFDEYEIVRMLGAGGFGITYLGFDHNLDKAVAIKEYLPDDLAVRQQDTQVVAKSSKAAKDFRWGLERFLDEARTLARFDHRNIIRVFRFFRAHGTGYIVMEYAEGDTLQEIMDRKGKLTRDEIWAIMEPILKGLTEVHKARILHRDIKPENIIIRDSGAPVLIDFGSARQAIGSKSRSITAIVTAGFAPMEQYTTHGNQGPWTDIYSMAAVVYKCLTGKMPPEAPERVLEDPYQPLAKVLKLGAGGGEPLYAAIDAALRTDMKERPQDIPAWTAMLTGDAAGGEKGKPPAGGRRDRGAKKRGPWFGSKRTEIVGLLMILMVGAVVIYTNLNMEVPTTPASPKSSGPGPAVTPQPEVEAAPSSEVRQAQELLNLLGYEVGPPDGLLSTRTVGAIRSFEADQELIATGEVDALLIEKLRAELVRRDEAAWAAALEADTEAAIEGYKKAWPGGRHGGEVEANQDRLAWQRAKAAGSVPAYEAYLKAWPLGAHAAEVPGEISRLQAAAEEKAWTAARGSGTLTAYQAYRKAYPGGKYADAAAKAVQEILGRDEEAAWTAARGAGSISGYEAYKTRYPSGKYSRAADKALARLRTAAEGTAWDAAKATATIAGFEAYKARYPKGKYVTAANRQIGRIRTRTARAERDAWKAIASDPSVQNYRAYLRNFPKGANAAQARRFFEPYKVTWERVIGGTGDDAATALEVMADGGLAVAGWSRSGGAGSADIRVMALDSSGKTRWERSIGGPRDQTAEAIAIFPDGGLAVAGGTRERGASVSDMFVTKLNVLGNTIWERSYESQGNEYAASIAALPGGRLVVTAVPQTVGRAGSEMSIAKLESSGEKFWELVLGSNLADRFGALVVLPRGGMVVATSTSYQRSHHDIWLFRLDPKGKQVWGKAIGGPKNDFSDALALLADGSLILVGRVEGKTGGVEQIQIRKFSAKGEQVWQRSFAGAGSEGIEALAVLPGGGLAVAGRKVAKGVGDYNAWVMKLDAAGNLVWEATYGGVKDEIVSAMVVLSDGGLVLAGATTSKGRGGSDIWILRLDPAS